MKIASLKPLYHMFVCIFTSILYFVCHFGTTTRLFSVVCVLYHNNYNVRMKMQLINLVKVITSKMANDKANLITFIFFFYQQ